MASEVHLRSWYRDHFDECFVLNYTLIRIVKMHRLQAVIQMKRTSLFFFGLLIRVVPRTKPRPFYRERGFFVAKKSDLMKVALNRNRKSSQGEN